MINPQKQKRKRRILVTDEEYMDIIRSRGATEDFKKSAAAMRERRGCAFCSYGQPGNLSSCNVDGICDKGY